MVSLTTAPEYRASRRAARPGAIDGLVAHHGILSALDSQRVKEPDWVHDLKRPGLPSRHIGHDLVGDRADEVGRHLGALLFQQESLNLPHRHAGGIHGNDLVVEAREAPFVLGDQYRLETTIAIAGDLQADRAVIGPLPNCSSSSAGIVGNTAWGSSSCEA